MHKYKTHGTCSREIQFDVADGKLTQVHFVGGCKGNLTGIARLTQGMAVEEVIARMQGIRCQGDTSCPDQLARALVRYLAQEENKTGQDGSGHRQQASDL